MSLAVSYTTHTVEITASGLAVAAIGNSVEVSAYNHVVQVSPLVYQVSVAQAGVPGPTGPGVPLGGTTGQVMVKLSDADLDTGWGSVGVGDMLKSTYDTDGDGKVDAAEVADSVPWSGVTDKPSTYTPSAHKTSHATGGTDALSPADIGAATASHNHDGVYSPVGHDHDLAYSPLGHDHTGVYSPIGHDHSGVYAPVSHSHAISDVTNLQTTLDGKASTTHNHDSAYASITHTHTSLGSLQLTSQAYYDEEVNVTGTTFNLSAGNHQKKTMSANITVSITVPSGPAAGFIHIIGHATNTYTIGWPSSSPKVVWLTTAITSITAGKSTLIAWKYDGTNLWLSCPGLVTTP